jgi:hypothetical protein
MTWMAYFEVRLAKLKKKNTYIGMRNLSLHTNYCLPTQLEWEGIIMYKS